MKIRSGVTGELGGDWEEDASLKSSKQLDGNSCGAFVLLVSV